MKKLIALLILSIIVFSSLFAQKKKSDVDIKYYRNGNISTKKVRNSIGEVIWIIDYYKNGKVLDSIPIKNDSFNGTIRYFNRKGKLAIEDFYEYDVLLKQIWYLKNSTQIIYYKNGKKERWHIIEYNRKDKTVKKEYDIKTKKVSR